MPPIETRIATLRRERRRRYAAPAELIDRSAWDWYAESCPCGLPPGECRVHPRARPTPAAPRGRLAGLGLYCRPRGGQDARRAPAGSSSGSTTAP